MDNFKAFVEGLGLALLLALFGGAAKECRRGFKTWRRLTASLFVSGFAGVITHLLLEDTSLSAAVKAALAGLAGYSGTAVLDALSSRLQRDVDKLPGGPGRGCE